MKKFSKSFIYDLLISFIPSLVIAAIFNRDATLEINVNISSIIKNLVEYKFYIVWLIILLLILLLRHTIRRTIEQKQDEPLHKYDISKYNAKGKILYSGFCWIFFLNIDPHNLNKITMKEIKLEELNNVEIEEVEGPFCINDMREMKMTRTYFGRYKYKCPKCKYTKRSLKNITTLENDVLDESRSKYR